jgi:hypothetical protein
LSLLLTILVEAVTNLSDHPVPPADHTVLVHPNLVLDGPLNAGERNVLNETADNVVDVLGGEGAAPRAIKGGGDAHHGVSRLDLTVGTGGDGVDADGIEDVHCFLRFCRRLLQ